MISYWERVIKMKDIQKIYVRAVYYEFNESEKDITKAIQLYKQAAEKGNLKSLDSLGRIYQRGKGVEKNLKKALEYYTLAATKGHAWSQHHLGHM